MPDPYHAPSSSADVEELRIPWEDRTHAPPPERPRRWKLPLFLFLATCLTTFACQGLDLRYRLIDDTLVLHTKLNIWAGLSYAGALMAILLAHEFGHFLQTVRYGVPASYPFFIPMPIGPLGTMGAVIAMDPYRGNRKALFDIAISGPIAGLIPAIAFSVIGLEHSKPIPIDRIADGLRLGEPLLFKWLALWKHGTLPEGMDIALHPLAYAGWVGFLITALNLFPIGQLDGGHILYALLRRRAYPIARAILFGALGAVIYFEAYEWTLMLFLLFLIGPKHPPTSDDYVPLGTARIVLGWLMLAFVIVGFTPTPFDLS